ncbi:leucine--tRNA ligase [Candidatus Woesearchaeota archaeon]|nr:leucine--tRNA ligase [Candidatus Woesearchaeota archaeon]
MTRFTEIAHKWQQRWKENKVFEVEPNKKEKLFVTVPYPYISGSLHIGHARVVTEMDVYSRYHRMSGKNVLYPIAFHISGTPVLGISLAIKNGDEKTIQLFSGYVGAYIKDKKEIARIIKTFEDPQAIVDFFVPKMIAEFSTLGLGVDWRRSFTSGDVIHQRMVEWLFHKYKDKGYLVQGKHPVLFSKSLNNAVGEDDIKDGDTDPVEKQEFTLIKFAYEDGFIVAATLRPETMFGQTNMWINPKITYVKAKVDHEIWYFSKECADKLQFQDHNVDIIEEIAGTTFLGKTCFAPFVERDLLILPSTFCNPAIGTGIVTSVPADAPFDWIALKELQDNPELCTQYDIDHTQVKAIELIPIINSKGYGDFPAVEICKKRKITSLLQEKELKEATQEIYKVGYHTGVMRDTCGKYAGMKVEKAKQAMRQQLLEQGRATIFWETSRPALSRDGGEVIVAILDNQWFIDFNAKGWKAEAKQCLDHMSIVPEKYRKRFEDVFEWLDKRPCARRRGLGTTLPFDKEWVIESLSDSVIYMSLYPIAQLVKKFKISGEQMTVPFFNYVFNGYGVVEKLSKDVGIPVEQLHTLREHFDYWYPNDHRHTFTAHLSNHLSFMIFAHVAAMKKKYWPQKISFHGMILREGNKMSKSKGNTIPLLELDRLYGADVFRAFMCSATSVESTLDWQTEKVEHMKKHLLNLYTILETAIKHQKNETIASEHDWFISRWEQLKQQATAALEEMDLRTYAMTVLYDMFSLYKDVSREAKEQQFHAINGAIITEWIRLLCPLVPHIAEELYEQAGEEGFASLAPWPKSDRAKINTIAEFTHDMTKQVQDDVRKVIELAKIEHPHRITIVISHEWKYALFTMLKELLEDTRDMKSIISSIMDTDMKQYSKEIMKIIPAVVKDPSKLPHFVLDQETEYKVVKHLGAKLGEDYNTHVLVEKAEVSTQPKARNAAPAKPAIVVE